MSAITAEQATATGDDYMIQAKAAYEKADGRLRLEAAAIELARANYLQTRALAYYQYAANVAARADAE